MADIRKRVPENVEGDFFVDTTCIDCDTCRQLASHVFGQAADSAYVFAQPQTPDDRRAALQALVCCPTGSIGSQAHDDPQAAMGDFPLPIEGPVYYCGFTSPKSFGGSSYFVRHSSGNWLVDSPKYLPPLVKRFEAWGGVDHIFLTHEDDVAEARKYARHFGSRRYLHRADLAAQPDAEVVLDGADPRELAPRVLVIPTPGHTAGHCVLLVDDRFLFTGDHLAFDRDEQRLTAYRDYCWDSWPQQIESMRRLASYDFEWVLPGHGQRVHLPRDEMRRQLLALVEDMEAVRAR